MKQTAVEWLEERLDIDLVDNGWYFEKAKQMEKQQKMDAWNDGNCNTDLKGNPSANYAISAEHYYNQKYGSNNEQQ